MVLCGKQIMLGTMVIIPAKPHGKRANPLAIWDQSRESDCFVKVLVSVQDYLIGSLVPEAEVFYVFPAHLPSA